MKNISLKSIVVLTSICLVITVALAVVNFFTAPVIEENTKNANNAALKEVLSTATSFEELDAQNLPKTVVNVYKDSGNSGYAMILEAKGYKGGIIRIAVGFNNDGKIVNIKTIDCSTQTAGLGSKVGNEDFTNQFVGKNDTESVDTISGATISSKAYKNAVNDAFNAIQILLKGQE
ncbi:MAG: FMN-binding protein [Clostridia bacterium]|nr:FMN-binding protein [Clostridia bacterium]